MLYELNPLKNWRGWLVALILIIPFAIICTLDGPKEQAAYAEAAKKIQMERGR
ncbi:hypothetical protein [Desulfovibrio intestinalis]|uniref:Uncharacterized protein n=1 Tax=Desulfovibrio intestinalis TaxID=58621 RepID=A0A7W8C1K8_9BACT|nr:hypothetical protein [Desulfovibrio intestinalis]MBB5143921.1 hypothetical protein [Desulfovibrio intestinalis]